MKLIEVISILLINSNLISSLVLPEPSKTTSFSVETSTEDYPKLFKRYRDVIINPDYQKKINEEDGKLESSDLGPAQWYRTISSTIVEIVTPTVIAGVTFNAKPPKTTNGLEPWVSLNKDGGPKTIKPQNKNGQIKNGRPDYGTYFQTATTKTYNKQELRAHNMDEGAVFEEIIMVPEDETYISLNPLIRCTPDRYYNNGQAKNVKSAPFCTPRTNQILKLDKTYFATWYSRFFAPEVQKVRIHLAYVKESFKEKGYKRNLEKSFFISDWIYNENGYYPLTIKEEWLRKQFSQKILLSIQPDNISDDEFEHVEHSVVIEIAKSSVVMKQSRIDLEEKNEGPNDEVYYIIMGIPTCVMIAAFCMYVFVRINKIDLSHLKKKQYAREKTTRKKITLSLGRNKKYERLPQYNTDTELGDLSKTD